MPAGSAPSLGAGPAVDADGTRRSPDPTGLEMVTKLYQDPELRQSQLRVNRIHPVRGGLMVEAADDATRDVFLGSQVVKNVVLDASALKARRPRMKIYDVPRGLSPEIVLADLFELNLERGEQGHRARAWCRETDIRLTYQEGLTAKPLVIWVAEVSPEARAVLVSASRVSVGWRQCRVTDYVRVSRCYHCQRFSHIAKFCGLKPGEHVCVHCGGKGH